MSTTSNLLTAYLNQVQDLETAVFDLLNKSGPAGDLDLMVGQQLDNYGTLVQVLRQDSTDAVYRARIRARTKAMLSFGTVEELIEIIDILITAFTGSTQTITTSQGGPAEFIVSVVGPLTPAQVNLIGAICKRGTAAGVSKYFFSLASLNSFQFASGVAFESNVLTGFGDNPPTFSGPGGEFSSVYGPTG